MSIKQPKMLSTIAATAVLFAAPLTAQYEGLRLEAYLDPVGIPTICYGETEGVKLGHKMSKAACDLMFREKLGAFSYAVDMLSEPELSPQMHAAITSFTYNVGIGALQKSTLLKKLNNGDLVGACNELPRWNKAGGKVLPGLVKRRQAEKSLCLKGAYQTT